MLATTTSREDDSLVAAAAAYGVPVFRGPADDVLLRFVQAARSVGARDIVRATADNPLTDIDAPVRVLKALRESGADHVVEHGLPHGAAVEAMTMDALCRAAIHATDPGDREHVTTMIRRDRERFTPLVVAAPSALHRPELRLTVDTMDDLDFMRGLAASMNGWNGVPELAEAIRAIDASRAESKVA
jgi:spore coat polysaccharide biosynthesis protein SpsF (cytidylyltransferase family)